MSPTKSLSPCRLALVLGVALLGASCGDADGDRCVDPCEEVDALRCYGSVIQRCWTAADGCLIWGDQTDCADQGLLCLAPITGPECGMLCTDPCQAGMSRCSINVWQTCEADQWGCMSWEDFQVCDATSLVCDDTSGDATCVAP